MTNWRTRATLTRPLTEKEWTELLRVHAKGMTLVSELLLRLGVTSYTAPPVVKL